MNVRQLHTSYVLKEDRVLLRLLTSAQQEYRLWLTRAMTGQCLASLEQAGWGLASAATPAQLSQPHDGASRQVH